MKKIKIIALIAICLLQLKAQSTNRSVELLQNWKFYNADPGNAQAKNFNDSEWEKVTVPHDWAAHGDFDLGLDIQLTTVIQDGESTPRYRCGRTGALPYVGVGWYRTNYNVSAGDLEQKFQLLFDGAMSNAKVYVNGEYVGERPFGYISFYFDITPFLTAGDNSIAVRLENFNSQSRWYPGAGLYRKVSVIKTNKTHVKTWGTYITTPSVSRKNAKVNLNLQLVGTGDYTIKNEVLNTSGNLVATKSKSVRLKDSTLLTDEFDVSNPTLWSIETPALYTLKTSIIQGDQVIDTYETTFGIRTIRFELDGFYLNDKHVRFKGVNMHHDLGPVGAAFHRDLFVRQMTKLKEMGVNAIRFSHNPPAPEALDVCDEMGLLAIDEAFDEWQVGKVKNGYAQYFDKWAKTDLTDMILRDRNHPSIMMWSIGNEIMEQYKGNPKICNYLNDIVKTLDTTRATTAGFNNLAGSLKNGLALTVDVAGFNYKPGVYHKIREAYPNLKFYASETTGSVSVRNAYNFPVRFDTLHDARGGSLNDVVYADGHPGNYETTNVSWGYPAYKEFAAQEYNPFVYGEFVWTGYDYLGEPSPYHEAKSRSSYFAPIDFVGLEKDKFYLYQSQWNKDKDVLHLFPHWTWPDMKGEKIPVVCYTSLDKAELFVNGKSYGVKTKQKPAVPEFLSSTIDKPTSGGGSMAQLKAYAIVWEDVTYEPGEIKVVAYNAKNKKVGEITRVTAGEPDHITIVPEKKIINKGDVGVYVVSVADKDGNLCPHYNKDMTIEIAGAATFLASGNGDPVNLQNLSKPERKLFNGQAVVFVQSNQKGEVHIKTVSDKLQGENEVLVIE